MPEGVGYLAIAAIGEETTVNVPVNATQRLRELEFDMDSEYSVLMDESLQGDLGRTTPELGVLDLAGTWRCYNTYTLSNLLLKHFFGSLSGGVYTFIDNLVGKSLTWAIDKTVSVWELSGIKINELTLSWDSDGVYLDGTCLAQGISYHSLTYTATTISADSNDSSINDSANGFPAFNVGDKITISGFTGGGPNGVGYVASRTAAKIILSGISVTTDAAGESVTINGAQNTAAELAGLLPNTARRMKIAPDLRIRLGVGTAALTGANDIFAGEGSITFTRPMATTHTNGTRTIFEPSPDNFFEGTMDLTLTRYNTNQFQIWRAARTRLALEIFFKEEVIVSPRTQTWTIPNLILRATPSPVSGPGFIPLSLTGDISIGQDTYGPVTTISFSTTDDSINDSANGLMFLYPGAKVFVAGAADAANNGVHTVLTSTASKITVSTNLTTAVAGASITLVGKNPLCRVVEA